MKIKQVAEPWVYILCYNPMFRYYISKRFYKINQVVEESWEDLLNCGKDLQDARLEDGENFFKEVDLECAMR